MPFRQGEQNRAISQPEVAGPSWSSQRPRRTLPHAPVAYPTRWTLGATAMRRCWRRRRPKRPSQIFLAGRRRRAALDCRPPLWGHGIQQKTTKQQSTCGWRRARAAGGLRGVTEVTRYARIINLVAWRRRAAKKLPPPPLLGQQKTKKLKQQSTGRMRRVGGAEYFRGARK